MNFVSFKKTEYTEGKKLIHAVNVCTTEQCLIVFFISNILMNVVLFFYNSLCVVTICSVRTEFFPINRNRIDNMRNGLNKCTFLMTKCIYLLLKKDRIIIIIVLTARVNICLIWFTVRCLDDNVCDFSIQQLQPLFSFHTVVFINCINDLSN